MTNTSILAAFERMWQHITTALSNKSDISHMHEEYLVANDIADLAEKTYVDEQLVLKANVSHTHDNYLVASDIADLAETEYVNVELANKANTVHTHTVSQISGITATATELNYMDGVTSNVQTQLNSKANKATTLEGYGITDAASKDYVDTLIEGLTTEGTADAALVQAALAAHKEDTNNPHGVTLSQLGVTVEATELNYLDGVTSNVQNQISAKADIVNGTYIATAYSEDGISYTATVPNITELTNGVSFIMIPEISSSHQAPTLNVNGFGEKRLCRYASHTNVPTIFTMPTWLRAGHPIRIIYVENFNYWIVEGLPKPVATDLNGAVPIANGGTGAITAEEALTNLGITATATELNYLDGATSNIQTQLNSKPNYQYSTTDLTAGSSELATGELYFVYE